ncbi:Protein CBG22299 [Caenorhabditis briggsae]|uniref:Protein CBG22299 n=1 Tax=Caenorhabditis briggsae TaxID=6238 RepID=A8Y207_CAEBR|nr:Protein CBG22299 [Caenorhabditis briggsae]CAP38927.2 Protein CBG22299 [Caenorhabditis briggsae]
MNSIIFKYSFLCFSIFLFIILLHHSDTISQTVLSLTHPIPIYYSTWHKCVQRQLLNTNETPETFWKNFVKRSRECDKSSNIWENMRVIALKNQDEMKYAVLPVKKSSNNVFVTLGIGQDITAEEAFQKEMTKINQNVTFYGADPIVEGNSEKYSTIGKFFPFAIGAEAGFSIASVLQDGDYKDVSVVHVDIYYFLSQVLKENKIDYLWMDTEFAEYELFNIFYKNEKLSRMDIAFCQMSLEVHNPSLEQKKKFKDFIEKLIEENVYGFFFAEDVSHIRLWLFNFGSKYCVEKFLLF